MTGLKHPAFDAPQPHGGRRPPPVADGQAGASRAASFSFQSSGPARAGQADLCISRPAASKPKKHDAGRGGEPTTGNRAAPARATAAGRRDAPARATAALPQRKRLMLSGQTADDRRPPPRRAGAE